MTTHSFEYFSAVQTVQIISIHGHNVSRWMPFHSQTMASSEQVERESLKSFN